MEDAANPSTSVGSVRSHNTAFSQTPPQPIPAFPILPQEVGLSNPPPRLPHLPGLSPLLRPEALYTSYDHCSFVDTSLTHSLLHAPGMGLRTSPHRATPGILHCLLSPRSVGPPLLCTRCQFNCRLVLQPRAAHGHFVIIRCQTPGSLSVHRPTPSAILPSCPLQLLLVCNCEHTEFKLPTRQQRAHVGAT